MQSTTKQQILGYFIEEAKEHLDRIEQGLVNLQDTMADAEQVNELFRAAHSVKGGAAMLGFDSIQRTAHHFEECFKILKEQPVNIDQKLEDLFLKGFDTLKALIEALQGPFGLREEEAQQAVKASEPTFIELENYLHKLINIKANPQAITGIKAGSARPSSAINPTVVAQLNNVLRAMLQLFRQGDTAQSRQKLVALCKRLVQAGSSTEAWVTLLQMAQRAIANPQNSYSTLTPVIIKELKQASELMLAGRASEILPSRNLQKLAASLKPVNASLPTLAVTQPLGRETVSIKQSQFSIPREPRAAARTLLEVFNKAELIEIAEFLMKAIQ